MKTKVMYALSGAAALGIPIAAFARSFASSPFPKPEPYTGPIPFALPPGGMDVVSVVTGITHRSAAYAFRGGSFFDERDFAMAGALIRHPQGDLLIDTGFGRDIADQVRTMPAYFRAITNYTLWQSAADQLHDAGYDAKSLRAILLTHSHWDHVSGLPDFPNVPVWVTRAEREYIRKSGSLDICKLYSGTNYREYRFEDGPYLGFPKSYDVYGDGAIVVVPAPGHTPGGVIIFATLPNKTRYAFVGDIVWQLEAMTQREDRPWIVRCLADSDAPANQHQVQHMISIKDALPELIIVPAHDMRGFAQMKPLSREVMLHAQKRPAIQHW